MVGSWQAAFSRLCGSGSSDPGLSVFSGSGMLVRFLFIVGAGAVWFPGGSRFFLGDRGLFARLGRASAFSSSLELLGGRGWFQGFGSVKVFPAVSPFLYLAGVYSRRSF